jgi:anthranilate synthase component I
MALFPDFGAFAAGYEAGRNQIVWTRLAADLDTAVSLMLKLTEARADSFILESVTGGEVRGRYSIIGMKPDLVWECRGTASRINREARFEREAFEDLEGRRSRRCDPLIAECRIDLPEGMPAAAAGLFGYLGYDMIRLVERLPNVNPDPLGLPDAVLLRPSVVAVLDGVKGEVTVVSPAWVGLGAVGAGGLCAGGRAGDGRGARPRARGARDAGLGEAARVGSPCRTSPRPPISRPWRRPRTTSARATSSRSCRRRAGRRGSSFRPSRFIVR